MNYSAIKGELAIAFAERMKDMHTDSVGLDYEEYFVDLSAIVYEISKINSMESLSNFCKGHGLDDGLYEGLSFPELISKYYE